MKKTLQLLINYLEGKWISQQTMYDLKSKSINTDEFEINILSLKHFKNIEKSSYGYICQYKKDNNKEIIYHYIPSSNALPILGTIKKIDKNIITEYMFLLDDNNIIKLEYCNNNTLYNEYTYLIHENFKLSIIIIKQFNQYKGICFISNIKII